MLLDGRESGVLSFWTVLYLFNRAGVSVSGKLLALFSKVLDMHTINDCFTASFQFPSVGILGNIVQSYDHLQLCNLVAEAQRNSSQFINTFSGYLEVILSLFLLGNNIT